HTPIVVARDAEMSVLLEGADALVGLPPVAHQLAQTPQRSDLTHLLQHGTQGDVVAMYGRDDPDTQGMGPFLADDGRPTTDDGRLLISTFLGATTLLSHIIQGKLSLGIGRRSIV